ncbi:MAG TPA: hypothetical protein VIH59_18655, partial [Candidatus Tectomicrobia bacterium]
RGTWRAAIRRGIRTGNRTGILMAVAIAVLGKAMSGTAIAPLNAISHILWGKTAAAARAPSLRYTATGLLLNQLAGIGWAVVMEKLFGAQLRQGALQPGLLGGAVTAALAYVTDYYVLPRRLTPGFESHFPARAFPLLYGALAVSLSVGAWWTRGQMRPRP